MKKSILFYLVAFSILNLFFVEAWAQEEKTDEFTLEEITVTSEKRAANLQELASSIVALPGEDLVLQGRSTTKQILESVPNINFMKGGSGGMTQEGGGPNPNGNISVRGIQRTQNSGGFNELLAAATGVYADEVYQGIGGNYDLNRVEVLRGPQGTLYGRSATAGVVSFYTNDPKLGEFGGNGTAEFGTGSLINLQGALNVPVGEKVALRAAAHYYARDGLFDYNEEGDQTETKEGRIKALFEPSDALRVVVAGAMQEIVNWGGTPALKMSGPNEYYVFEFEGIEPEAGAPQKYSQISVHADYDFGESILTWIGSYYSYDYNGYGPKSVMQGNRVNANEYDWKENTYNSQEVRLASDSEGPLSWLVGANYFKHKFDTSQISRQFAWPEEEGVTYEDAYLAIGFGLAAQGDFENYGLFTEETYELSDDFRITAGLRYDKTKLTQDQQFYFNMNASPRRTKLNPPNFDPAVGGFAELVGDKHDYDNVTYKLRLEYDVTPDSMLYFLTSTGFMPGYSCVSPSSDPENPWNFLMLDQQKLTSYEIGTKNQFLDDTLRLNAAAFYYDYEGYPEATNVRYGEGPPTFTVLSVPLEVIGLEVEVEYLLTMYDKLSLYAGYLNNEIAEFPESVDYFPFPFGETVSVPGTDALSLKELPGNPDIKATLAYDHTFLFGGGSTLVPRAEVVYTSGYYLRQMSFQEVNLGQKPYNYRDSLALFNVGATWTSANQMYSVTGYVRNAFDEEYKSNIALSNVANDLTTVALGDPRTFGVMISAKF